MRYPIRFCLGREIDAIAHRDLNKSTKIIPRLHIHPEPVPKIWATFTARGTSSGASSKARHQQLFHGSARKYTYSAALQRLWNEYQPGRNTT